jgi:hypothetical protein
MDDYTASLSPAEQQAAELSNAMNAAQNADLVKRLMDGDKEAKAQFENMARRSLGQPEASPFVPADAGAAVDLFAENAAERLPTMIGTASESAFDPQMTDRQRLDDINGWRSRGRTDEQIRELHDETRAYTPAEHDFARACVQSMMGDPSFQRRLFSGDAVAERMVLAASTILSGGVKAA